MGNSILSQLKRIEANELFTLICQTQLESLKSSRVTNNQTPHTKKYVTKIIITSAILGEDYEKLVNTLKSKLFNTEESYVIPISENGLVQKHKDKDQFYIQLYPNKCKATKTLELYYDVNGRELTQEEFKSWQKEYGVENTKQLELKYTIENVKGLKQGDIKINPSPELLESIKKLVTW